MSAGTISWSPIIDSKSPSDPDCFIPYRNKLQTFRYSVPLQTEWVFRISKLTGLPRLQGETVEAKNFVTNCRRHIVGCFVHIVARAGNRGRSRTAATSKMELFVIIVNGFQPLTIITKCSILDVAAVLDPSLGKIL